MESKSQESPAAQDDPSHVERRQEQTRIAQMLRELLTMQDAQNQLQERTSTELLTLTGEFRMHKGAFDGFAERAEPVLKLYEATKGTYKAVDDAAQWAGKRGIGIGILAGGFGYLWTVLKADAHATWESMKHWFG